MIAKPVVLASSIVCLLATKLALPSAFAASLQWDSDGNAANGAGGGAGTWNATSALWFDGTNDVLWPNTNPNNDTAIFGGTGGAVSLSGSIFAHVLQFDSDGYSINDGGSSANTLTLSGAFPAVTVTNSTDSATISAIVAGTAGLTKAGAGTLVISGANTFSGGVFVSEGTLSISSDGNLGNSINSLSLSAGSLTVTSTLTTSRALALESDLNVLTFTTGASVWNGAITGAGGFTKSGAGSLQLGGSVANTFTGLVNVNQGTLSLNKTAGNALGLGVISITSNNTPGFGAANISLSRNEQIDDTAPLVLSANGGLRAGFDLNNFIETVGPVTLNSATVGSATIALGATGKLVLNGDLTFNNNRNATGNTGREVLITGTGTYSTAGPGGVLDLGGVPRTITVNTNNTQASTDATIEAVIDRGSIVKEGSRVLRLGAANTYNGFTRINNGTIRTLVAGAIPSTSDIFVSATAPGTTATLDFNGLSYTPKSLTLGGGSGANTVAMGAGTLTLANNIIYDATNDPQTSTISGNLDLGGVARTFDLADSAGTGTELLISAIIAGTNTGITKTGPGVLAISGANTFTGPIIVNAGSLAVRGQYTVTSTPQINPGGTLLFDAGLTDSAQFNNVLGTAANGISVDGGTIRAAMQTTASVDRTLTGRVVTIGPSGAVFDVSGAYTNFTEGIFSQLRFGGGTQTLVGSSGITKNGGGRIQFQVANANFSGPVVINDGTFEASGAAIGNSSATNTITINGGNWAVSGDSNQPSVILNGGAMSTNGANRIVNGAVTVASASHVFLNNFWTDAASGWNLTLPGLVSGAGDLAVQVNRTGYDANSGTLILQNAGNTFSGNLSIEKNLTVDNNSSTGSGKTIGTSSVTLLGGHLRLRDNASGSNGLLTYGNNITVADPIGGGDLAGTAAIVADRSSGANTGNTIRLGTLTIGSQQLDLTGNNGYRIEFAGLSTFTGSPILNVTSGTTTLAGGLAAAGQTFTKNGPGTLRILGVAAYDSFVLNAGTLEVPTAPSGTGRTITIPTGVGFSAGYVATQANLIDRITLDSAGVVALGVNAAFNPDFTGFTGGIRLGGTANATLTGTITPADGTVRLGGGGGTLTLASTNAVSGAANLDVNINGTVPGTVVLAAANNFIGTVAVGGGMVLRLGSNASIGGVTSPLALDNGTIQLANGGNFTGFGSRVINAGAGGAVLDTDGNDLTLSTAVTGTGTFTKAGNGTLTLADTSATFTGKTVIRAGTLSISADTNLGAVPAAAVADQLQLTGGTLLFTAGTTIPTNRGITLGAGGGTIDTSANAVTINSAIAGANPLVKNGTGTLSLTVDVSYTGATTINAGVFELGSAVGLDSAPTVNSGGTLRTLGGTNAIADGLTVTLNAGGTYDIRSSDTIARLVGDGLVTRGATGTTTLTLNSGTAATFNGVIENGTGTLAISKSGANTVTFTNTSTYTGTTQISSGLLAVQGPVGALGNTPIIVGDNNGGDENFTVGQATDLWTSGTTINRIGDTGTLTLNGRSRATYTGPAAGSSGFNEVFGAFTVSAGANTFTLIPGTGADVQLSPSAITRTNNGTFLLRADNLGGTGIGSARLIGTTAPALLGGAGAAGSNSISIIPWIIGDTSTTGPGSTFATYDSNGVRPLTGAEYASTIAGAAPRRNVSTGGGETVSTSTAVNALRITGGSTTINPNTSLTIGSGAVLFTAAGSIDGTGTLEFGNGEGIIHLASNTAAINTGINAAIRAGNGLTIGSYGFDGTGANLAHLVQLSGSNSIGGNLTVNSATLRFGSNNASNRTSPATVVLRPGAGIQIGGNNVILNSIVTTAGTHRLENVSANDGTLIVLNPNGAYPTLADGTGGGVLNLVKRGVNTFTVAGTSNYNGTTVIDRGAISVTGTTRLTSSGTDGTSAITIAGGGLIRLTNTNGGNSSTDRLRNAASITMNGGTFDFDNNASSGTNYSETTGAVTLAGGFNIITADQAASANTSAITFASLTRNAGSMAVLNFLSQVNGTTTAGLIGATTRDRIVFTSAPTLNDGIIGGWSFVDGVDFATYNSTGTISVAAAPTTADPETAWDTTKNIKLTTAAGTIVLTAPRTVNSLNLPSGQSVDLGGFALNVDTGGVIHQTTVTTDTISNGTITAGDAAGAELIMRVTGGTLTASATIADNTVGAVGLNKTGAGKLVLTGANTYTGPTSIGGTLSIANDAALGLAPSTPTPAHLRIFDGGVLEITGDLTLNANRGIELNGASTTISQTSGTLTYNGVMSTSGTGNTDLTVIGNANFGGNVSVGGTGNFNTAQTIGFGGATTSFGAGLNIAAQTTGTPAAIASNIVFSGTGALQIGGNTPGVADLNIGYRTVTPSPDSGLTAGKLDLTSLSSFTASVANIRLGVITAGGTAGGRGDLLLPTTSNITAAAGIVISDSTAAGNNSAANQSTMQFGAGISTVTTPLLTVGGRKGNGRLIIANGGTLNLGGFGAGSTDLYVARNNQGATAVTNQGLFDFSNGTLIADLDELVIGFKDNTGGTGNVGGSNGIMTLGPSAHVVQANSIRLGDKGSDSTGAVSGTLNLGGGTVSVVSDLTVGVANLAFSSGLASGTVNMSGGAMNVGGNILLGSRAAAGTVSGTLNITGGSLTVGGDITTTNSASSTATLSLNGGSLDVTGGIINTDSFTTATGTLANVGQIYSGDGSTVASLTKSTPGTLILAGTHTYTGGTNLSDGTLLVNGSITGSVNVSGGVLGGNGTIGGAVNVTSGVIAPGNSAGILRTGNLTLSPATTLSLEIGGLNQIAGVDYDQLNVTGTVNLGGSALTLSLLPQFNFHVGDVFLILLNDGTDALTGSLAGFTDGQTVAIGGLNFTFDQSFDGNNDGQLNDVALISQVPEPSSLLAMIGGMGMLAGLKRFRRRM